MNKIGLIIVDHDENYLSYLNNYLSSISKGKFEINCFTDKDTFISQINNIKKKDVLIINTEMYDEVIETLGISSVLFLDESNDITEYEDNRVLHKFRDVKNIQERAVKAYLEGNPKKVKKVYAKNTETQIITVYSPVGGCGKSLLAATLSNALAEEGKKVLYLNLEDIQSTSLYFSGKGNIGFSDIILDVKDKSDNFINKLITGSAVDSSTNVSYLNPTENILDIEDINEEDIKWLLEAILKANKYSYVIIDTVSKFNSVYSVVLNSSHYVITPILCDENSKKKLEKFVLDVGAIDKYHFVYNMYDGTFELEIPECLYNLDKEVAVVINEDRSLRNLQGENLINGEVIKSAAVTLIETLEL